MNVQTDKLIALIAVISIIFVMGLIVDRIFFQDHTVHTQKSGIKQFQERLKKSLEQKGFETRDLSYNTESIFESKDGVLKNYCNLPHLSTKQRLVIQEIIESKTFKQQNIVPTMLAIAWQESSFGLNMNNYDSGASGIFHVMPRNVKYYNKKHKIDMDLRTIETKLVNDFKYSSFHAMNVINFFKKINSDDGRVNWDNVYSGYYAGYRYKAGMKYANQIKQKIKKIESNCYFDDRIRYASK